MGLDDDEAGEQAIQVLHTEPGGHQGEAGPVDAALAVVQCIPGPDGEGVAIGGLWRGLAVQFDAGLGVEDGG